MEKRNSKKAIILGVLSAMSVLALTGCIGKKVDSKNTIYLEPFSGSGFGYTWIQDLADEWAEETNSSYKIKVNTSSVDMASSQLEKIASGTSKTDIYFGANPEYKAGLYKDYFEDIGDLLDVKPDGETGMTIRDKITDFTTWKKVAAKVVYNKETNEFGYDGFYMLPYTVTLCGQIFDYDLWEEKNWLTFANPNDTAVASALTEQGIQYTKSGNFAIFQGSTNPTNYEQGDKIATPGKDGKYGTYDDGQPITFAEFNTVMAKIQATSGSTPFIYSIQGLYLDSYILANMSQIAGLNTYHALCEFNSLGQPIEMYDSTASNPHFETITWDNGYKAYQAKGIEESVQFVYDNFYKTRDKYFRCNDVSAAQDKFVAGLIGQGGTYALINEGNWFETEAAETIKAASKKGGDKQYGQYDFRFLLNPVFEGQKGIDGEGNGSFMCSPEYGAIVVRKQSDADKLAAIKSFLTYYLRNESLAKSNVACGVIQGYNYTIPEELKSQMTVFQRNCYELYSDKQNIKVLSHVTDKLAAPMTYASASVLNNSNILPVSSMGSVSNYLLDTSNSVSGVMNRIRNNYAPAAWEQMLEEIKEAIQ